jgi:hypothetical protein
MQRHAMLDVREPPVEPLLGRANVLVIFGNVDKILLAEVTTQIYLDANLTLKQAVLDRTTPPKGKPGRYRPDDRLLAFLKGL